MPFDLIILYEELKDGRIEGSTKITNGLTDGLIRKQRKSFEPNVKKKKGKKKEVGATLSDHEKFLK